MSTKEEDEGTTYAFEPNDYFYEWNVRAEPKSDSKVKGLLVSGQQFQVFERQGDWLKVKAGTIEGWAMSKIESFDKTILKPVKENASNDSTELSPPNPTVGMSEEDMLRRALELSVRTAEEDRKRQKLSGDVSGLAGVTKNTNRARSDVERYLNRYPETRDDVKKRKNLLFFQNTLKSKPDELLIEEFLKQKFGDYEFLERAHGYIQWLFPTRDSRSTNEHAQPLQLHEAKAIGNDPKLIERALRSYEMILDFFGMRLVNRQSGQIERKKKFEARYKNLQESSHNYLRITRILKFLGEIEKLEHFQAPFVAFLLDEMLHLELTNASDSLVTYFIPVIRDKKARETLLKRAESLKPPDEMPLEMRIQSLRDRLDVLVDIEKKKNEDNEGSKTDLTSETRLDLDTLKKFSSLCFNFCKQSNSFVISSKASVALSRLILPALGDRLVLDLKKWCEFLDISSKEKGFGISSWSWCKIIEFAMDSDVCTGTCSGFESKSFPLLMEQYVEFLTGKPVPRAKVSSSSGGIRRFISANSMLQSLSKKMIEPTSKDFVVEKWEDDEPSRGMTCTAFLEGSWHPNCTVIKVHKSGARTLYCQTTTVPRQKRVPLKFLKK